MTLQDGIIVLLWLTTALADTAAFCAVWQRKEYRLDRMRDFLGSVQGKRFLLSYPVFVRSIAAIAAAFIPLNHAGTMAALIGALLAVDGIRIVVLAFRHQLFRPIPTAKAILLIGTALVLEGILFARADDWSIIPILLIIRFYLFSALVIIARFPTEAVKRARIRNAERALKRRPRLLVIGVTGSYGKTSVKTMLAHILSGAFRVIATPEHTNTDIGIASFILRTDFTGVDIFVVEMGAYRIGEIQVICDMTHPTIGILTAINEQHLSLFGSMRNIQQAKYELLRALPKNGLAVANADNPYCTEFLDTLSAPAQTFHPVDGNIRETNLAPCRIVAAHLGMSPERVAERIATLPDTLLKTHPYGKAMIIDDSYNANPDGFRAALSALEHIGAERERIVITRGMLELGERSDAIHTAIGEQIGRVAHRLILVNHDAERPLRAGIVAAGGRTMVDVLDRPEDVLHAVRKLHNVSAAVLVENRISEPVARELNLSL
jgi:UDP-N-acetylmuramoyl-tripeptide--D-alanyl-D-alanine ligase